MKLEYCVRDIDAVAITSPILLGRAQSRWRAALDVGAIPRALFRFYEQANYFSPEKAPTFFADPRRMLFSYLGTITDAVRQSLVDAQKLHQEIRAAEETIYTPVKKARGEAWDRDSPERQRRALRYLLLNLSSSLDQLAEVVALFFTNKVGRLRLGRASFAALREWLGNPLEEEVTLVVEPLIHFRKELYDALQPLVIIKESKFDWVSLFLLYRNKLGHLGGFSFTDMRLHDEAGDYFGFLPRRWPFIFQEFLRWDGGAAPNDEQSMFDFIEETCIHIDLIEFVDGIMLRVREILEAGFSVLSEAYKSTEGAELNEVAFRELQAEEKMLPFLEFANDIGSKPSGKI